MEEQYNSSVVKTSDWVITLLILAIPLVNIIMLFVWAFGSGTTPSKANFAKASLIWALIAIVIYGFITIVFGAAMFSAFQNFQ